MENKYSKLTILGSGTSTGIPMITCSCAVCTSLELKDKRLRSGFHLLTKNGKSIIIDTSPDLRAQVISSGIEKVDFCILTHDHADHVHGIDDLRPFTFNSPTKCIKVYTHEECRDSLHKRFAYIFDKGYFNEKNPVLGGGIPKLETELISDFSKEVTIEGEQFTFFLLPHGNTKTLGILYESMAILIDCHIIPSSVVELLAKQKLSHLIIDCVKDGTHQTHLTLDKSLEYIDKIGAKNSYLTHIGHQLGHQQLLNLCKNRKGPTTQPAYDSMQIVF